MEIKPEVFIRADGSPTIGLGHLVRCSALAHMLKADFQITFFCKEIPDTLASEFEADGFILNKIETEDEFLKMLKPSHVVVLDGYEFETRFHKQIKAKGCKLVCIDDSLDIHYSCDIIINSIPGTRLESIKKDENTKVFIGNDYVFVRKEFQSDFWRNVPKVKGNVFVSFGGADPYNLSKKYAQFLKNLDHTFSVNLLIGHAYQHYESLKELDFLTIHKNLNARKVAELISQAEISIIPASGLLDEVAIIGSRLLLGYYVENQLAPYNYFINNKLAMGAGNFLTCGFRLFETRFFEALKNNDLIKNQRNLYGINQSKNIKNIFKEL